MKKLLEIAYNFIAQVNLYIFGYWTCVSTSFVASVGIHIFKVLNKVLTTARGHKRDYMQVYLLIKD